MTKPWFFPAPRDPIARKLFESLCDEQEKRSGRTVQEWIREERERMWLVTMQLANRHISMAEIELAERSACGHTDYTLKYALGCAELVRNG